VFKTLAEHWDGSSWSVTRTPDPGRSGDHLYAVDAVSPDDVWAVGQKLGSRVPDQGLVEHWNGRRWQVVPLPASPANVLLDGVTVADGQVWAVGEADTPDGGLPLIEHYSGGRWTAASLPAVPDGSNWANLYGVAVAGGSAWAVGTYVDPVTDNNSVLLLRGRGDTWTLATAPNPGSGSNLPGGLTAVGGQLWMGGIYDNGGSELPLIEHR